MYGNTIFNNYSLDDEIVAYNNPQIEKGIKAIPEIFTTHYSTISEQKYDYRPIVKATFAIEYSIFGGNPHISHLINIIIYIFLSITIFYFLKRIFKGVNSLFIASVLLIFIAHPIHSEVVASIKNRDVMLSMLGSICATIMFLKYSESSRLIYILPGFLFFLFGILSKSDSMVFLIIIPLTMYLFSKPGIKKVLISVLVLSLVCALFIYVQRFLLPDSFRDRQFIENPILGDKEIVTRISMLFSSLFFYASKMIFPHPLLCYYGYNMMPVLKLTNPMVIISAVFHAGIFIYSLIILKKKLILAYGILFYLISIALFGNFIRPVMGIVGERLAFSSSLGFSVIIIYILFKIFRHPILLIDNNQKISGTKIYVVLVIILIPSTLKTIVRNTDWKDHLTLYQNDIKYLENSAKANDLLASTMLDEVYVKFAKYSNPSVYEKKINEIIHYYNQSLKVYSENKKIHNNLGMIYLTFKNDPEQALVYLQRAINADPDYATAHFNAGYCYSSLNIRDSAITHFETAVSLNPEYTEAMAELSKLYYKKGMLNEAVELNEKIISIKPDNEPAYINLGNFYVMSGDTLKGLSYAEEAIRINPGNKALMKIVADMYKMKGDLKKAEYYYNLSRQ